MIERVTLRDFQPHAHFDIKLDRVNCITGASDIGKTAILRAVKWALLNRPSGGAFVRHGRDVASVTVRVDGRTIRRKRGRVKNGLNAYALDGRKMKAFGSDVPEPIATALKVGDVNFQDQLDGPFWFSASAGEVSRSLNEIVDLGVMDETLNRLNAGARSASVAVEVAKGALVAARDRCRASRGALDIDRALRRVERLAARAGTSAETAQRLAQLVAGASRATHDVANAANGQVRAMAAVRLGQRWRKSHRRATELVRLAAGADRLRTVASRDVPDIAPLESMAARAKASAGTARSLAVLVADAERLADAIANAKLNAAIARQKFEKSIGEGCPLCGSKPSKIRSSPSLAPTFICPTCPRWRDRGK